MVSTTAARQLMTSVINDNTSADITPADVRSVFSAAFDALDRSGNGMVNVLDFGAKLDGTTDDTAAWNAALATGKTVLFPEGSSVITGKISFPFLEGGAIVGVSRNKSVFLISHATFNMAASAVIEMNSAYQGLHGFAMKFVQPTTSVRANIKAYPPAININNHSRSEISGLRIEGAFDGILATGNCGGAVIDDIQISALRRGSLFDGSMDSVRINRWHFWPFGLTGDAGLMSIWGDGQTICMDFGKVDDLNISSILTYQGRIIFGNYGLGGVFGVASDITLDADYGRMEFNAGEMSIASVYDSAAAADDFAIRVTGGELRIAGLRVGGGHLGAYGAVQVDGGVFIGSNVQFLTASNTMRAFVQTAGVMVLSNGYINEFSNAPRTAAPIQIQGGRAVVTGMIGSDRPSGMAAPFISVTSDGPHVISCNNAPGWNYSFPTTATQGIYGPNNSGTINSGTNYAGSLLVAQPKLKKVTGTLDGSGNVTVAHGIASGLTAIIDVSASYTTVGNVNTKVANITFDATNITMAATASGASRPYTLHITYA